MPRRGPSPLRRTAAIRLLALAGIGLAFALTTPLASAAPISVSSCQTLDSPGAYALTADLAAVDATCIEITASHVKLDLAGHTISCTGSGFEGTCQVPEFANHGVILQPGLSEVALRGPGTITGFDQGIAIMGSATQVRGVTVTAPSCSADCQRPFGHGIFVSDPTSDLFAPGPASANLSDNEVRNYLSGISLWGVQCPGATAGCVVRGNLLQNNDPCVGAVVLASSGYTLADNDFRSNGSPSCSEPPAGIVLGFGSTANVLTGNDFSNNTGFGIFVSDIHGTTPWGSTSGNTIVNNTAKGNSGLDLFASPGSTNTWNDNNRCHTEGGAVPSSVCSPDE